MTPQIVYISGSGRSGSTLLERILHSAPGVFALGEFHCLWRLAADEITCACGTPFAHDEFWAAVRARAGFDAIMAAELRALESRICRTPFLLRHRFSLAALRAVPEVQRFLDLQRRLLEAVARESGAHTLVDSSKAGPRAWLLACNPDVRLVHLYRDPADVIASWRSRKFDPGLGTHMARPSIASAAGDWLKVELLVRRVAAQWPVVMLDYADLCRAPRDVSARLLADLGLSGRAQPGWTGPDSFIQGACYHSLNGNPDRFDRGPVKVSFRGSAGQDAPMRERLAIGAAARMLRQLAPIRR